MAVRFNIGTNAVGFECLKVVNTFSRPIAHVKLYEQSAIKPVIPSKPGRGAVSGRRPVDLPGTRQLPQWCLSRNDALHARFEGLLAVNDVLDQLAAVDAQKAELVKPRHFVGMTIEEAASVLGISEPTVKRWWTCSIGWLFRKITTAESR